jgi:DNA-directed RNA polymerase specialized sigma24 family protein
MSSVVGLSPHPPVDAAAERAFVQAHAARLRGFALLLALGDVRAAEDAARAALGAGARRAGLGHVPDNPHVWLRQRVLGAIHPPLRQLQRVFRRDEPIGQDRRTALRDLGVSDVALEGLIALSPVERAAVVAVGVEGLEADRLGSVLNVGPTASRRVLGRGFRHYFVAAGALLQEKPWARREQPGAVAQLVGATADAGDEASATDMLDEHALHRRLGEWLNGSTADLPATAAAHAAECTSCTSAIIALDALRAVDTARPVSVPAAPERPVEAGPLWVLARYLAPPAVVVAVALMQVAAGESVLAPAPRDLLNPLAAPPVAPQGIGGGPPGAATAEPTTEPDESSPVDGPLSTDGPTPPEGTGGGIAGIPPEGDPADPDATFGPGPSDPATPPPGAPSSSPGGTTPPALATPPPATTTPPPPSQDPPPPPPTPDPTPPPPPPPTPDPTPPPPPPPTPDPTPGGILPECADGEDNDGDGLVDLLDPGCLDDLDLTEN